MKEDVLKTNNRVALQRSRKALRSAVLGDSSSM